MLLAAAESQVGSPSSGFADALLLEPTTVRAHGARHVYTPPNFDNMPPSTKKEQLLYHTTVCCTYASIWR